MKNPGTDRRLSTRQKSVGDRALLRAIQIKVERLAECYRLPLVLYFGGDCTLDDIASILEIPVESVPARIRQARARLRSILVLRKDGSSIPRLTQRLLQQALTEEVQAPEGLFARVLEHIERDELKAILAAVRSTDPVFDWKQIPRINSGTASSKHRAIRSTDGQEN